MKYLKITLSTVLLFTGFSINAQNESLGFKGGISANSFSQFATENSVVGFNFGLFGLHSKHENYGFGADLNFTQTGGYYTHETEGSFITRETRLQYISLIPKAVAFARDVEDDFRPKLSFGPSMSFMLGAHDVNRDVSLNDEFKTVNFGLAIGTGFNWRLKDALWLNTDLEYVVGINEISDINRTQPTNIYTNGLSLSVGLAFGLDSRIKPVIE